MPKHVNFYENQYLRAPDMQAEQSYHIDMHRGHNAKLHTSGVVEGLIIAKKNDAEVTISEGMAIDKQGREIVLETEQTRAISGAGPRYITIAYKEELTDDPEEGFNVTGNDKIRVTESWEIAEIGTAADITDAHVILGMVVMEGGEIKEINNGTAPNHRRMSGAAGSLTIRDSKYEDANDWVTVELNEPGKLRIGGQLRIDTGNGHLDIGPQTPSYMHFITDREQYMFNKPLWVDGGLIGSHGEEGQPRDLKLHTHGTVRMTVLHENGNVGIGTEEPGLAKLVVSSSSYPQFALQTEETGGVRWQFGGGSSGFAIRDADKAAYRFWINNTNGNVGIGTTSPQSKLHVNGHIIMRGFGNVSGTSELLENLPSGSILIGGPGVGTSFKDRIFFYWKDENGKAYKLSLEGTPL